MGSGLLFDDGADSGSRLWNCAGHRCVTCRPLRKRPWCCLDGLRARDANGGTIMLAYTEHIHTLRTRTLLALLFGGSGIAFIFAGELHGAVCVITAMFVVSFLATPTKAIILTHIQRYANKIAIGRVVAMVSFGYWLGYMLGASGAGQLVERYGLTTAVTCVVVGRLVSAALGSRTLETQKAELSPAILQ